MLVPPRSIRADEFARCRIRNQAVATSTERLAWTRKAKIGSPKTDPFASLTIALDRKPYGSIYYHMVNVTEAMLDALFHALADPTRRAIVRMLAERPHGLGELAPAFPMSSVAVSKHVRTLEAAGLVTRQVQGRSHLCHLEPMALLAAHRWLQAYEVFWTERLDALESLLADMKREAGPP